MSVHPQTSAPAPPPADSGYVTVHLDHEHPRGPQFLFEKRGQRFGGAFGVSIAWHVLFIAFLVIIANIEPSPISAPLREDFNPDGIVWIAQAGPGGGGGGGGNQMKEPPRRAESPGKDKLTVPVAKPTPMEAPKQIAKNDTPPPPVDLTISAKQMAVGEQAQVGIISGAPTLPSLSTSQGSGTGGGAGSGTGTGIGPGSGSGLGPGSGGNTGGGVYQPGNGVSDPVLIYEQKPAYTAEALRAKIQGSVWVSAIVMPDGTVNQAQVYRSLDGTFGLDQEAIKAVRQWRFRPGMRLGQAVPVQVLIDVIFTLR